MNNKKAYLPLLLLALVSTTATASRCDDSILSVGTYYPNVYQYSIELTAGTIGQKGTSGTTKIDKQYSIDTKMYRLFSGEGTHGNISGKVVFEREIDHKKNIVDIITVPFTFTSGPMSCYIHPKSTVFRHRFGFLVDAHKARNHILDLKVGSSGESF